METVSVERVNTIFDSINVSLGRGDKRAILAAMRFLGQYRDTKEPHPNLMVFHSNVVIIIMMANNAQPIVFSSYLDTNQRTRMISSFAPGELSDNCQESWTRDIIKIMEDTHIKNDDAIYKINDILDGLPKEITGNCEPFCYAHFPSDDSTVRCLCLISETNQIHFVAYLDLDGKIKVVKNKLESHP
jgi:hypothetical protein